MPSIIIEPWKADNPEHARAFADLNREWLEEFFWIEPADEAMFADPQGYVIDRGGDILFARVDGKILGTIALLHAEDNVYELSKMGVTKAARGLGIGRKLAEALIALARKRGIRSLYIASNRKLARAIALYKNLGFVETPAGCDPRYQRADITLELPLVKKETGGPKGMEPTRYGDWEIAGKCVDF